jgi:ABC-type polysaccharide/polyol phosphate export permease
MIINVRCCLEIIKKELFLFYKEFFSRFIDVTIILITNVMVFGFLMTKMGLSSNFGALILVGAIASYGLFEAVGKATCLAQDVTDKKITNLLILPIKSSSVFISIAISWAIISAILSICLLPLGKLLLLNKFDLTNFSLIKFLIIFVTGNLFYGFFSLWISSMVVDLRNTSWLWCRIINPLFMFCGYYYSWKSAYELSHFVGYLHFFNPLLYVLEATKTSFFGQSQYLSYWLCIAVLWVFIAVFTYDAIRRFKKRLDFI